jgi:mannose/fructose/N-acetylgalactosamine-specific phosphotransferase system component IID
MYDDDQYGGNRITTIYSPILTTNDANAECGHISLFVRAKLIAAKGYCPTTAYDEATTTINIYVDDGSVGQLIMAASTLGQLVDATVTETVVSATSSITLQQAAATATGDCIVMLQYQEMFP